MAKLTRYTSFSKLKLSGHSIDRASSNQSAMTLEFEEFINLLRKASLKKDYKKEIIK